MNTVYNPKDWGGKKEEKFLNKFRLRRDDAKLYFKNYIVPRLDRSYKLYVSYNGDRAAELARLKKKWMANIFVPYIHAVVETLMPRILDARPDFNAQGRSEDDQLKTSKINQLTDYTWEISKMDDVSEDVVRSSIVYGMGYMQPYWKKLIKEMKYLVSGSLDGKSKIKWETKEQVYYDAPCTEAVDNYTLMYDWHNIPKESKQYWFKRKLLTEDSIKEKYPYYNKKRLKIALMQSPDDTKDYAAIRNQVKKTHTQINKGDDTNGGIYSAGDNRYQNADDIMKINEVYEVYYPFEDVFAVMVNDMPILKGIYMPFPYDYKEAPFIGVPFLKLPFEYEGVGVPLILENPQIMLNTMKNQRLDTVTLSIHKMWIINPLANINKEELVVRPFGLIYSPDPQGVREVEFSDVKASAYKEEELLKSDMRYASGVDDFSMAVGGGAGSATEIRHLRESTLERVRLFINHLGSAYAELMRYWFSMYRQFFTDDIKIRILGENGEELFPIIEKDDLKGEFDFKAAVYPSIAGKNDIDKKQSMDLYQLLINLPFVDQEKLTGKVLRHWNWTLDSVIKKENGMKGMPSADGGILGEPGMPIDSAMAGAVGPGADGSLPSETGMAPKIKSGAIPADVIKKAMEMLGEGKAPFSEAASPINLLNTMGQLPPTVAPTKESRPVTTNPRGLNRGGKVNTNLPIKNYPAEGNIANQAENLQS